MKKKTTKRREPKLKILPCPFCGEAPIVRRSERFDWLSAVECKRCLARVPLEATDAAIKSWNRRVSEPRPSLSRAEWKHIWKSYGAFNDILYGAGDWKLRTKHKNVKRLTREVERLVNAALKRRVVR